VLQLQANVKILEYKETLRDARMDDAKTERCNDERCKDRTNDTLDVGTSGLELVLWLTSQKRSRCFPLYFENLLVRVSFSRDIQDPPGCSPVQPAVR